MINIEQMALILDALPDPALILSKSGRYVAVFGGKDGRYYHDGSGLVGLYLADVLNPDKTNYFLGIIEQALASRALLIEEYELSNKDVKGLPDAGPDQPIWFEGRIQALDFLVNDEPVVLWVASNISKRHELELQLRQLSDTDQLTGLYNRRRLERDLTVQFDTFQRHRTPTSILILDLDHLKSINDQLGHHAGDKIIIAVAETCRTQFRKTDSAYRFGGDEFVIALPGVEQSQAVKFAEYLCDCFYSALQQHAVNGLFATVSIGVASIEALDTSYEDTLKRADAALYQAKRNGKNRVISNTA
ncbi:GGDEF domain-containing protein [Shewanella baltica]|uniref:GGDEF domain-containing protein n=1 Tax=Shewanella baltica TaxID=62322 RepID=UPI000DFA03C5|nr:sensor domain-containing diguanylate cyclase [Shewanella baltica]MCS6229869.1 GGDEF domain-containing protein [Shewanella baltica]MCS6238899.1 GGDEF domain-containing protein [Shewanella baltica]SUI42995.1 Probable diguanylate cyclase AdrA [Shewanella baltica]